MSTCIACPHDHVVNLNEYHILQDRQEATYVLANLQRQRVNSRVLASDYMEKNLGLIDILVPGYVTC